MWGAHQLQHQSGNLSFTKLWAGGGLGVGAQVPLGTQALGVCWGARRSNQAYERASRDMSSAHRVTLYQLFFLEAGARPSSPLVEKKRRFLGGFTTSLSSVPSAVSLQVLLDKTFPYCHLLASDRQRIVLQLPSQGQVWRLQGATSVPLT